VVESCEDAQISAPMVHLPLLLFGIPYNGLTLVTSTRKPSG